MNIVSRAEFARLKGWDRSTVTRFAQSGRLVTVPGGDIDVDASNAKLAETSSPEKSAVAARHAEARGAPAPAAAADNVVGDTYAKARAVKERFAALTAKMEYERALGQLVEKRDVAAAVADVSTTFRQALENLPHRISASLVGKDLDAIRAELKQEVNAALTEMEREFARRVEQLGQEGE